MAMSHRSGASGSGRDEDRPRGFLGESPQRHSTFTGLRNFGRGQNARLGMSRIGSSMRNLRNGIGAVGRVSSSQEGIAQLENDAEAVAENGGKDSVIERGRVLPKGFSSVGKTESSGSLRDRARQMERHPYIIDPQRDKWTSHWDMIMLTALLFTALVTPVEVSFLEEGMYMSPLWWINRFIDLAFLVDMVITFNMAFQEHSDKGGHWVYNRRAITRNYLLGWFVIDLFSVAPFFLITLDYSSPWGPSEEQPLAERTQYSSATRATVLFRIVKLLRMLKLTRVFKATRVIERHLLDVALHRWEVTYSMLKIAKLLLVLCMYSHFQACLWGLFSSWMGAPNWINEFDEEFILLHNGTAPQPMDRYAAAFYWSVMTLTSIGYGEFTANNTAERVLCSLYMLISGMMWTYAIGSVAAIATTLNPHRIMYENTMDQLNYFMRDRSLSRQMRITLREFFQAARRVHQLNGDAELLSKMSPLLQGSVALAANKQWIDQIWFFRDLGNSMKGVEFIASLAKRLILRNFVANERLPIGQMYILRRGLCVKMWRFLGARKVWGEDIILDKIELIDHAQAVALTYVECFTLRRNALDQLLAEYELPCAVVRKAAKRITLQRALLKFLTQHNGKRGPCSFVMRSMSQGADMVDERMNIDEKLSVAMEKLDELLQGSGASRRAGGDSAADTSAKRSSSSNDYTAALLEAQGAISKVKDEMASVKTEVASVKGDMAEIKEMMAALLAK